MSAKQVRQLIALGFDRSNPGIVACSQCAALVINNTPCHETGCPNAVHECAGCNALVSVNTKYCEDCQ